MLLVPARLVVGELLLFLAALDTGLDRFELVAVGLPCTDLPASAERDSAEQQRAPGEESPRRRHQTGIPAASHFDTLKLGHAFDTPGHSLWPRMMMPG